MGIQMDNRMDKQIDLQMDNQMEGDMNMLFRQFNEAATLSRLGYGNMRLPRIGDQPDAAIDFTRATEIVHACYEQGVNYFDTAYIYHEGTSEVFLGKALADYPRNSFYVADKYNIWAEPDYRRQFTTQLERLKMDRIDFYMLHGISDDTVEGYLTNGAIEYFQEQKQTGRIGQLGFSFHGQPEVLETVLNKRKWDFVQLQINYYDWWHGTARRQYELATERNIPVFVMEPVHGGLLSSLTQEGNALLRAAAPDKSIASWALRFVMGLPNVAVILSGMSDMEQTRDNLATLSKGEILSATETDLLEKACAMLHESVAVACTACRYCCGECPQGLEIPMLLQMYNEYKLGGAWRLFRLNGLPEEKRPGACIGCGACLPHCPQQIAIPDMMKEMADAMNRF